MVSKMISIAVISGKGGVGKSTVSANLAAALAENGNKVGVLDSDFHGPTIPKLLNAEGYLRGTTDEEIVPVRVNENLEVISVDLMKGSSDSPVIWRGPMKMNMIQQILNGVKWANDDIDYLIIDLPPGTGDEPLSIVQQIPDINGSIIVSTPQEVSVQSVRKSVEFSKEVDMPVLGIIENMSEFVCPNCGEKTEIFGSGGGKELAKEFDMDFLGSLPLDPEIVESGEKGEPFVYSDSESAKIFQDIIEKIKENVKKNEEEKEEQEKEEEKEKEEKEEESEEEEV